MLLLRERSGAWCPEKIVAFGGAFLPALWILWRWWTDDLGARPVTEVIHFTGDWVVRFLWITLAISPAARLFRAPKLMLARRTVGVTTAVYATFHILLYAADQKWNLMTVASEIVLRFYLTIGFVAFLCLIALLVTSTDGMVRRMAHRWRLLHQLCYPTAVLASIHYLIQSKNDVWMPILMVGLLAWLFGFRLVARKMREVPLTRLFILAPASTLLTMIIELLWYRFRSNVPFERILTADFDFSYTIMPMWYVLAITLAVPAVVYVRRLRPQRMTVRKAMPRAASGAARVQSAS